MSSMHLSRVLSPVLDGFAPSPFAVRTPDPPFTGTGVAGVDGVTDVELLRPLSRNEVMVKSLVSSCGSNSLGAALPFAPVFEPPLARSTSFFHFFTISLAKSETSFAS